jgi:Rrf2 family protein
MMKLNKSTRYALYAALEMARSEDEEPITVSRVAERYSIPAAVLAKVLQQLVRAGIAVGTRGSGGGYRLARAPSRVTMADVIEAFEPARAQGVCLLHEEIDRPCPFVEDDCRLGSMLDEVDEMARSTFASITLETLAARPRPGIRSRTVPSAG